MFGERMDNRLTMLQRVVALVRDLILATVALLTSVIVYYGGNPANLNALDWAKLVGAAFLIILGPIISFFVIKIFLSFTYGFLTFPLSVLLQDAPILRGPFAWLFMKAFNLSKRQYLEQVKEARRQTVSFSMKHPKAAKVLFPVLSAVSKFYSFQNRTNPYFYAILVLVISVIVFRRTIVKYIP